MHTGFAGAASAGAEALPLNLTPWALPGKLQIQKKEELINKQNRLQIHKPK